MSIQDIFIINGGLATDQVAPGMEWTQVENVRFYRIHDGPDIKMIAGTPHRMATKAERKKRGMEWVPIPEEDQTEDLQAALRSATSWPDGVYTLCGPRTNGNPEQKERAVLMAQVAHSLTCPGRDHETIRVFFERVPIKGMVIQHAANPSMRGKVERRQFGYAWPDSWVPN